MQLNKEYKELNKLLETWRALRSVQANLDHAREMLQTEKDEEMRTLVKEEIAALEPQLEELEEKLKFLLIPKDPEDTKNAIMEIRAGTGGDEASLFAGDLFRMYQRYCQLAGLKMEVTGVTEGTMGGYKEVICHHQRRRRIRHPEI